MRAIVCRRLPPRAVGRQHLQDMAAELGEFIQQEHAMVGQRHLAGIGTWPPPISPASEMVWWGARNGRVVTNAVRPPVRPATRWMRVVSRASARVIAGRMVVSRRASIDLPAPGGRARRRCGQNAGIAFCFVPAVPIDGGL